MPPETIAVTGAAGTLGGRIAAALEARGHAVLRLSRRAGTGTIPYDLSSPPPPAFFKDHKVSGLVHAAWDLSGTQEASCLNEEGSGRLWDAALAGGVARLVFISSLAAHENAAARHGRSKRAVEKRVLSQGGTVLRPGTIYGNVLGGLLGKIGGLAATKTVLPVFTHPGPLYLAHDEDVAALSARCATENGLGGKIYFAAGENQWTLRSIAEKLAGKAGNPLRIIPFPWRMVWAALRALEAAGLRPPFPSDSVLSLGRPAPAQEIAALTRLPGTFREFDQ